MAVFGMVITVVTLNPRITLIIGRRKYGEISQETNL